jgi:phosphotransferase system enzyme I (PtsI)
MSTKITKGVIASHGIKIGKAFVYQGEKIFIPKYYIKEEEIDSELNRFQVAIDKTKIDIAAIQQQIAENISQDMADIFASHIMMLEDPSVVEKAKKSVIENKKNIEWVINDISLEMIDNLNKVDDDYIRERIIDISDINKRLMANLQKKTSYGISAITEEGIVFASDLTPSETALMNKNLIMAFVTDKGGKTSHTAIMARALGIPAIVGTIYGTTLVKTGDKVIVDAIHGNIIINPEEEEIEEYLKYQDEYNSLILELSKLNNLPSRTKDDVEISIFGNIEIPDEMNAIMDHGAQGIGLFRSEFLFIDKILPNEEVQFNAYKDVAAFFNPLPVTIRTLDVGGDKIFSYTDQSKEKNPFLGCRAIRFSLENEQMFRIQLRAILRSSAYGNVQLMFPMITTVEELLKAKQITEEVKIELRSNGIDFNENIKIGVMIEIPSAVISSDILAKHADFFSVGTNDLVQYALAVDRINEKIAYLYNPLNISVLRLLKMLMDISSKNSIPVSICGEIAGGIKYTMLLIGLGFRELSMNQSSLQQVKKIIRDVTVQECVDFAEKILKMEMVEDIEKHIIEIMNKKFPGMIL